jgi:hypothetical protein
MEFATKLNISKGNKPVDYNSRILLVGSCFATSMGEKFDYFKFQNLLNPFGILFNPPAIENLIIRSLNDRFYSQEELVFNNEQWHCLDAHSQLSLSKPEELVNILNSKLSVTKAFLLKSSHIIITLGTVWVYQYEKSGNIVANCHKIQSKEFTKLLLTVETVSKSLKNLIEQIRFINQEAHVIFTVSPVRHLKDGFTQNTLSKSILIQAVHRINESFHQVHYFPSFEIMMDELRDYRFYKPDMIHPNELAINYIWEKFSECWIHTSAKAMMNRIDKVQKSRQHQPFNPKSKAYLLFLKELEKEQNSIKQIFNHINF